MSPRDRSFARGSFSDSRLLFQITRWRLCIKEKPRDGRKGDATNTETDMLDLNNVLRDRKFAKSSIASLSGVTFLHVVAK